MEVRPHSHPFEQLAYILVGRVRFTVGDEVVEVGAGEVLRIPPDVVHCGEPIGDETAVMSIGGRSLVGAAPFAKATYVATSGSSVFVGTADALEVLVLDPEGTIHSIFRRPGIDLAVRQEDEDWYRARMRDLARTPQEKRMLGMVLGALVFPETRAAYGGLKVDARGAVWLRTGRDFPVQARSREWTVFSREGVLLGTVVMPEGFEPMDFGSDYVLGVWKDAQDVEFVRLYTLCAGARDSAASFPGRAVRRGPCGGVSKQAREAGRTHREQERRP